MSLMRRAAGERRREKERTRKSASINGMQMTSGVRRAGEPSKGLGRDSLPAGGPKFARIR